MGAVRVSVSVGLLALILHHVDLSQALAVLRAAEVWPFVLCAVLVLAGRLLVAYRWYLLVRVSDAGVRFAGLARVIFVSGFLGLYAPGAVGVEAIRVYALARHSDFALALSSVLIERLTALGVLLGFVFLGLALAPVDLPAEVGLFSWLALAALASAFAGLFVPPLRRLALGTLTPRRLAPLRVRLERLFVHVDRYRARPVLLAALVALAVGLQGLRVAQVAVLAPTLGVDVPIVYFLAIVPVGIFLSLLPVSVQGFGVREAAYVVLLGTLGIDAAAALTLSVVQMLLSLITICVPGALLFARDGLALTPRRRDGAEPAAFERFREPLEARSESA